MIKAWDYLIKFWFIIFSCDCCTLYLNEKDERSRMNCGSIADKYRLMIPKSSLIGFMTKSDAHVFSILNKWFAPHWIPKWNEHDVLKLWLKIQSVIYRAC